MIVVLAALISFAVPGIDVDPIRYNDTPVSLWPTWDGYQAPTQ